MKQCHSCNEDVSMPYTCRRCNKEFCSKHRLPENHDCPGLKHGGKNAEQIISEIQSQNSQNTSTFKNVTNIVDNKISKYDGQIWAIFLMIMGITYILQLSVIVLFNTNIHDSLFVLNAENIVYFWTIITSIFSHSPTNLMHIIGNGIILLFFGKILEKYIGSKNFAYLFLFSGILAGLSQIGLNVIIGTPEIGVLGASGAILSILGALTVYNPKMRLYLYFIVPIPLWVITIGYVILSLIGIVSIGNFMNNIAHVAHLVGLFIGILYGYKTKHKYFIPNQIRI